MDRIKLVKYVEGNLNKNIDIKYKNFSMNLLPGVNNILGIRLPVLRSMSKEIIKSDYKYFLDSYKEDFFEEVMLKAFVIGLIKDIDESKYFISKFIPKIDNWSINDSFCSSLKIAKTNQEEIFDIVKKSIKIEETYTIRFSLVMMINYYINDEYIEEIFDLISQIRLNSYYVNMAMAWLLTEIYINYNEKLINFLYENELSTDIIKMLIRKVKDSYQISDENKDNLVYHINKMKNNNKGGN